MRRSDLGHKLIDGLLRQNDASNTIRVQPDIIIKPSDKPDILNKTKMGVSPMSGYESASHKKNTEKINLFTENSLGDFLNPSLQKLKDLKKFNSRKEINENASELLKAVPNKMFNSKKSISNYKNNSKSGLIKNTKLRVDKLDEFSTKKNITGNRSPYGS